MLATDKWQNTKIKWNLRSRIKMKTENVKMKTNSKYEYKL